MVSVLSVMSVSVLRSRASERPLVGRRTGKKGLLSRYCSRWSPVAILNPRERLR